AERRAPVDPVPRGQEAREHLLLHRLDLASQRRERGATEATEDVGVAPLALGPARTQFAAHEQVIALELDEHAADVAAEALVRLFDGERPASLRVAQDELAQRLRTTLQECLRQATGRHRTE